MQYRLFLTMFLVINTSAIWAACGPDSQACAEFYVAAAATGTSGSSDESSSSSESRSDSGGFNDDPIVDAEGTALDDDQLVDLITSDLKARRLTRPPGCLLYTSPSPRDRG